jgi:hypothetical protein
MSSNHTRQITPRWMVSLCHSSTLTIYWLSLVSRLVSFALGRRELTVAPLLQRERRHWMIRSRGLGRRGPVA